LNRLVSPNPKTVPPEDGRRTSGGESMTITDGHGRRADADARWRRHGWWAACAAFSALYIATGLLGLSLAVINASATPVWMPTGVALAGMLVLGVRSWPMILASAFVVNLITSGNAFTSLGIAVGNTAEAVAACWLLTRFAAGRRAFDRPATVFRMVPLVLAACAVSASVGVAALVLGGTAGPAAIVSIWTTWWLGDAMGAIVACPLLVLWANDPRVRWNLAYAAEGAAVVVAAMLTGVLVFGGLHAVGHIDQSLVFLCLLPILWAAMRFGPREAAAISLLILAIAVQGSLHGHGPFIRPSANETLLLLQLFMGITTVTGLVVAAMVAERRRLEGELETRARELARSNQELEQFAYIAAHDLQEPLRMIVSYSQMLERRLRPQLDAKNREFLTFVSASAERMQSMVRSILAYSRIGKESTSIAEVDTEEALREAVALLGDKPVAAGATIASSGLPRVTGSRVQLVRLFQNLLSNAIKFRSERPLAVRVLAERDHGNWRFSVNDNGIGIPAEAGDKLFGLFQRLHSLEEYPGEGIGLASCKKIVEQHGGRIWFDSVVGEGTTFRFTLPDADDRSRPRDE
jgi:signal transduction histidine kinase